MILVAWVISLVVLYMLLVAGHNALHFPRLDMPHTDTAPPCLPVSILIPARNEARNIGPTVTALMRSTYPSFEVIVLDDASTDGTAELARQAAPADDRLRVVHGSPLPHGWLGKSWACHQLAQLAASDLLVFTDADVHWTPEALTHLVAHHQMVGADLLAVWPTQLTLTLGERLTVPLMSLALLAYLPIAWAHDPRMTLAAAANGQCLSFWREAYSSIGGHQSVRNTVLEDVTLARLAKKRGLRLRLVDAQGMISCRMYHGFREAVNGYTKNILAAHAGSIGVLLLSTLVHLALFIGPWLWLIVGLFVPLAAWPHWPALLLGAGFVVRLYTAITAHLPLRDVWLLPDSVLLASFIALRAIWLHLFGAGPNWKGRSIHPHREPSRDTR